MAESKLTVDQAFSEAYGRMVNDPEGALDVIGERISELEQESADRQAQIDAQARHIDALTRALDAAPKRTFDSRCADVLADEVDLLVRRHVIDARSPAADALLDYRNPPSTERADRILALEQHISELEKSLENVQSDLESARATCNGLGCGACSVCVQQARDERDAALARLKPSGKVAEDVADIKAAVEDKTRIAKALLYERIDRLAAQAQGYEAMAEELAAEKSLHDATHDELHKCEAERDAAMLVWDDAARVSAAIARPANMLTEAEWRAEMRPPTPGERLLQKYWEMYGKIEKERDAAVADNAALVAFLTSTPTIECFGCAWNGPAHDQGCEVATIISQPHPGTALLERMKRLEEALVPVAAGLTITVMDQERARYALGNPPMTCENASCLRCRSGWPCH